MLGSSLLSPPIFCLWGAQDPPLSEVELCSLQGLLLPSALPVLPFLRRFWNQAYNWDEHLLPEGRSLGAKRDGGESAHKWSRHVWGISRASFGLGGNLGGQGVEIVFINIESLYIMRCWMPLSRVLFIHHWRRIKDFEEHVFNLNNLK